jgi:diguanylate cyclase (GGDEF)-like protein
LALLDLNGLKAVNDAHGHAAGDELLAAVSRRLEALAQEDALVARLGGDEFALLIGSVPVDGTPPRMVRTICEALAKPFSLSADISVSISAGHGLAFFPAEETDPSRLLALADGRLYARKRIMQEIADSCGTEPFRLRAASR